MDVGVEINQYVVVEHIGRGGMADVWSARDRRLNRTVAIKTIARDLSVDTEVEPVRLFEREAQTIARLEHPHILPIYDFGEFEGQLYIVMRYVTGGSLEDFLADGPLPVREALRIARSVGHALDHAHANQVVHLDIKPSNILMDSNRSPYLADFGLATVVGPEGRAANPGYGTLLYMAPEQLTADVIDHRADIYAFTILIFHMLTGEMPFDSTTSLALKQLQFQEDLPNLDTISPDLPQTLTPILRRGTALNVDNRPSTTMELVEDLERVLLGETARAEAVAPRYIAVKLDGEGHAAEPGATIDVSDVMEELAEGRDLAVQEAMDIYLRARRAWSYGQGRFLLGITHFMLISDYYMKAAEHDLELDEPGTQMFLRGALEYDHEVDFWWNQLDDDNRRWVALHAVRSDSAPARVRALQRLQKLPDSSPPRIPGLVAQALQIERDQAAMLAALNVLEARAPLMDQLISPTIINAALTLPVPSQTGAALLPVWREKVFSVDIDELLAETALESPFPAVAQRAARTIGRIRSLAAISVIAEQQRKGTKGALRVLALVRDEAPSLPSVVSNQARFYAWLENTRRRLSDQPLGIVGRYLWAFAGGFAALGAYAWVVQPDIGVLLAQRSGLALSTGLIFALMVGFVALLAGEFPARLRGFWNWGTRLVASAVLGLLWGALTWGVFTWFLLNYAPDWNLMLFGGVGLALGYVLTTALRLPGWLGALLSAASIFAPLYLAYNNFMPPIVYFSQDQVFSQGLFIAIAIAVGGHAQALWKDIQKLSGRRRAKT